MDDQEFFDALYQLWSKTSGAEERTWFAKENDIIDGYCIMTEDATPAEAGSASIADFMHEADAKFIAFVHGVIPELVRRTQDALDESDRLDAEKDELIAVQYGLEMEIERMTARILELEEK
ncbi:hypothetical protein [Nocardia thraciensis]